MLTELKAYSSWQSAPTLPLNADGRAETDLIQIRGIDGLNPVKASVTSSPFGSVDGASYTGSTVLTRNIVLTLHPNPDWKDWTYESLRRLVYSYFMPKKPTRLVFSSDDIVPVEIFGIVESVELDQFSKDQEIKVSVICPDPYFTAVDLTVVTGSCARPGSSVIIADYDGNIESGIYVKVTAVSGAAPSSIAIQVGDPAITYFTAFASVDTSNYFEMSSIPTRKYVQNISLDTGVITNLLSKVYMQEGSSWPVFQPGENEFMVYTDQGVQDWELRYYERFGGL